MPMRWNNEINSNGNVPYGQKIIDDQNSMLEISFYSFLLIFANHCKSNFIK